MTYDPRAARYLCFSDAARSFSDRSDSPRGFLERCLEQIETFEPKVRAFAHLDIPAAKASADAADARWRSGRPLSPLDGMPIGIKDCFDVKGMPTEVNSGLFRGNVAGTDAAHVDALRRGGAIIVGKTTTTELTMALPPPTWNPWDLRRTPGGSSSGSAAAVAARMLPLGTGSQVRGSVIRPASICGVIGMKPTFGALNRHGGVDPSPSLNHLGFLAGTLADVWAVSHQVATVAGGDPGYPVFPGGPELPAKRRPLRLGRQYTSGWPHTDEASKAVFERFLRELSKFDIDVLEPQSDQRLAEYEEATARTPEFFFDLMTWELRWPMRIWREERPGAMSENVRAYVAKAEAMQVGDYSRAMARRDALRMQHRALAGKVDAFITLAHIGPGQMGQPSVGTPWYNDASSAIGAPTFNLPILSVDDVPLGVQIMGFEGKDEELAAMAQWFMTTFTEPA
jgi:Asp-tRNA(Asn)/Glu-tRNA(Gln) amidotransferase A subunit family amidase